MNEKSDMMRMVCNIVSKDKHTTLYSMESPKTYDTGEIYADPRTHMSVRGMFRYCNVDVIE